MNKQWYFENGVRLYMSCLALLIILLISMASGALSWSWFPLIFVLIILAGNIKLTHGIMFSEGKMKYWNIFCSIMFNGLCIFWLIYGGVVLLGMTN